jgi:hypothetical protein
MSNILTFCDPQSKPAVHHQREKQVNHHHLRESKTKRVKKSFHRENGIEREGNGGGAWRFLSPMIFAIF